MSDQDQSPTPTNITPADVIRAELDLLAAENNGVLAFSQTFRDGRTSGFVFLFGNDTSLRMTLQPGGGIEAHEQLINTLFSEQIEQLAAAKLGQDGGH